MANSSGPTDPAATSLPATGKTGKTPLMEQFSPGAGGYDGASVESGGEPGDKGVGVESEYSAAAEDGNQSLAVNKFGDYPHSGAQPDNLEGPPPGSTGNGPNNSGY